MTCDTYEANFLPYPLSTSPCSALLERTRKDFADEHRKSSSSSQAPDLSFLSHATLAATLHQSPYREPQYIHSFVALRQLLDQQGRASVKSKICEPTIETKTRIRVEYRAAEQSRCQFGYVTCLLGALHIILPQIQSFAEVIVASLDSVVTSVGSVGRLVRVRHVMRVHLSPRVLRFVRIRRLEDCV